MSKASNEIYEVIKDDPEIKAIIKKEEITQDMISKSSLNFDGTCPFYNDGGECSSMSVEECNKCKAKETIKPTVELVDLPDEEPKELTMDQIINSIAQDTENTFWMAINRFQYKVRKFVKLSDSEYDIMLEEAKNKIILMRINAVVLFDLVKELDIENENMRFRDRLMRLFKKEKSVMDKYSERMEELNAKSKNEEKEA